MRRSLIGPSVLGAVAWSVTAVAAADLPPAAMQVFVARCQICHLPTSPGSGDPQAARRPLGGIGTADLDAAIAAALAAHPGGALRLGQRERKLLSTHVERTRRGK